MNGAELGVVEDTLFVPMLGRIYASENCKNILYDKKALELKSSLPKSVIENDRQTQYTYLASASRSANMDRYIADFLKKNPDGIIVQLGVGLETTFYRCDNGHTKWYGVDLPNVIEYRKTLLPEHERETYIAGDALKEDWIKSIREEHPKEPILVTASGLFYYFEKEAVLDLMRMLGRFGRVEILFDVVNKSGMTMIQKKHMKTVGHEDAKMYFYANSARELASEVGPGVKVLADDKFFDHFSKSGLQLTTKISMGVSDLLSMVKMVQLGF